MTGFWRSLRAGLSSFGSSQSSLSRPEASIPIAEDAFTVKAREMIEAELLNHPDEGVRAITAMFGVPDEAVEQVAAKLRGEVAQLAAMPDSEIDCSDIPETTDWSGAVRGRFARKGGDHD